jgi:hypothetical protein
LGKRPRRMCPSVGRMAKWKRSLRSPPVNCDD